MGLQCGHKDAKRSWIALANQTQPCEHCAKRQTLHMLRREDNKRLYELECHNGWVSWHDWDLPCLKQLGRWLEFRRERSDPLSREYEASWVDTILPYKRKSNLNSVLRRGPKRQSNDVTWQRWDERYRQNKWHHNLQHRNEWARAIQVYNRDRIQVRRSTLQLSSFGWSWSFSWNRKRELRHGN